MKAKEGSMGMFCRVGVDIGNHKNSTFLGASCISDDPRKTRGRPAKNTRKSGEGRNLNNRTVLRAGKEGCGAVQKRAKVGRNNGSWKKQAKKFGYIEKYA